MHVDCQLLFAYVPQTCTRPVGIIRSFLSPSRAECGARDLGRQHLSNQAARGRCRLSFAAHSPQLSPRSERALISAGGDSNSLVAMGLLGECKKWIIRWMERNRGLIVVLFCLPASFIFDAALVLHKRVSRALGPNHHHDKKVQRIQKQARDTALIIYDSQLLSNTCAVQSTTFRFRLKCKKLCTNIFVLKSAWVKFELNLACAKKLIALTMLNVANQLVC